MVCLNHVHEHEVKELATKTKLAEPPKTSDIYKLLLSTSCIAGSGASPNQTQKSLGQILSAPTSSQKTSSALPPSESSPNAPLGRSANNDPSQPVAVPLVHNDTLDSSMADKLDRNEDTRHEIKLQLASEQKVVPEHGAQANASLNSSNGTSVADIEITKPDREDDAGEEGEPGVHSKDGDIERFNVEAILSCKLNPRGIVHLQVKWEDYQEIADITWEPERTLREDVPDIINAYFNEHGGRNEILKELRRKATEGKAKGRRKPRASARGRARARAYLPEPTRRRRKVDKRCRARQSSCE